jgi:hypothetical protein
MKGRFYFVHKDKDGNIKDAFTVDNTITNAGKAAVANLIQGGRTATFKRIELGSSATAALAANTTLAAAITSPSLKRVLSTASIVTTTVTDDTSQLVHTFTSTATQAVKEVGVFDTPTSGGTMISRTTFTAKNLTSGDTLQVTHKIITS